MDLVKIGPTAADLADLYEYHLDFPGHALEPDCDYERWATRLGQSRVPTAYGHVATEPSRPGLLALQHEGAEQADWDDEKLRAPGRAPGGVLQRPDRAEHETAVDRADQLVRELAALIRLLRSPERVLLLIGVLLAIVIFAIERAT